jgi:hypothetical protein
MRLVGYANSLNPGWTFVPTDDLRVVAVGYPTLDWGRSYDIYFWAGTDSIITTNPIAIGSNTTETSFQPVDGSFLKAETTDREVLSSGGTVNCSVAES